MNEVNSLPFKQPLTYVEHLACGEWTQVGRCVICACGERLFNGKLGKEREAMALALDAILEHVKAMTEEGRQIDPNA